MSCHLIFFLRWLLMSCLLMRNLLTFSTKKSHMSRYLKSSLLTSLYRFIHQDARRLLMSDIFVENVSRLLMSKHLMSSHLKKKMRWLLMRYLLTTTWMGLLIIVKSVLKLLKSSHCSFQLALSCASIEPSADVNISTDSANVYQPEMNKGSWHITNNFERNSGQHTKSQLSIPIRYSKIST